jgi:hypothetical protein
MPELDGKKYSYDKKGIGQYKKDLAKKGYAPQTGRDMNAGYTPQTQMTNEQLAQKAYGAPGVPQSRLTDAQLLNRYRQKAHSDTMLGATFLKKQQMMAVQKKKMMAKQEAVNQKKAEQIATAVDSALTENVELKKQLNLSQIQLQKEQTINKARQKPIDITKKRTGK